ncbi:DUF6479 family protein [Streptomyces iconiensis]|uniref:DUF6479 family protein n=1 Tax=Streptomyces iconiensis TaxID=1384038 RepID=A0ABT7A0K1_9ACTN|nr:DUF6479 family protein [Streptomyces iconiensis]MDJ1134366.1 DUF6479 family protein [Streptomyces iconiensis]
MDTYLAQTALEQAVERDHLVGIFPLVVGLVVVGVLIAAVWLGIRVRRREPPVPPPEEQPKLPDEGPVDEIMENREPDELPQDGVRRLPHVGVHDNADRDKHPGEPAEHGKWTPGKSGSFGSGGPG